MKMLDVIELLVDLPDHGLRAGSIGTIVDVYKEPRPAYEVEFVDQGGTTTALATVEPDQIRLGGFGRGPETISATY